MIKVSVVILNYNGKAFLQQFLPGVIQNSPNCEIIVADNHSTDDSIQYLQENHSSIRIIRLEKNYGFSEGYNQALKSVESQYYVLLNSDVEVTQNWIPPIISYLDENPSIAACQPKIRSYHRKEYFEYAGAAGGFIDKLGYPFCRGRVFQDIEKDTGQYDNISDIFWATGACLFIRSEIFHSVGGFDSRFFAHMEEIDLCWRIRLFGYRICFHPESIVYHVGGGTLPKENPKKTYLNFRNSLVMLFKNSSSVNLFWKIPLRLLLDLLAAIKFLFSDGRNSFFAVLLAEKDFLRSLPHNLKKRKVIFSEKKENVRLSYRRFLLIDYYIFLKKKFSDLKVRK